MKSKIWLLISGALLTSSHLQADDGDYSNRQFSVNPGNMVDGMFNPMRGFFGGSNRYSDDYYKYRYAPPPAYQPGYGYGYPGSAYGYPPVYPGYQPLPQTGGYPSNIPAQQPPAAAISTQPPQAPASSGFAPPASGQANYSEQYHFRPLDSSEQPTQGTVLSSPTTQQSHTPLNYPTTQQFPDQSAETQDMITRDQTYRSNLEKAPGSEAGQMKFRPLDKPGYSE
ncbi:MAG: hypothetical protein PVJ68_10755 [Candidatus Thiodiazotropha sp.]|jgi:hypothetical protein